MSRALLACRPRAFVSWYQAVGLSLIAFSGTMRLPMRIWTSKLLVGWRKMSASLSPELKKQHNCRSIPVRKEDEVRIVRGTFKGKEGKVVQVYRKKWVIHVDKVTRDKVNGALMRL